MKTILIVVAGMADRPDPITSKDTPLTTAHIPSLDLLGQRGILTSFPTYDDRFPISHVNSLLSLLGYDLQRGEPNVNQLMEFGLDHNHQLTDFETLRPFVIPGFSGHGVCITPSAWVRGVAKCAFLRPLDIYSPGSADAEIADAMAKLATQSIQNEEFVLVYIDTPLKASLKGNYQEKIRAIEQIDRHLIAPIADFVWKSELMINLAVTTDLTTPWHRRRPTKIDVPLALYFNNHDSEGDLEISFTEVESFLSERFLLEPSDLIKYLINFSVSESEDELSF